MAYTIGDGRSIKSLLGGTVKYIIPRYQRKYIWDDKHWQDLYDDLIFVYNNRHTNPLLKHFFSTFIFEKTDSSKGIDCFNVIDGQQRMSTTMVIISVICRICIEKFGEAQHTLFAQYLSARDSSGKYIKISNDDSDLLGTIILENSEYKAKEDLEKIDIKKYHSFSNEQKNIYKCYEFFYNKINSLIEDADSEKELHKLEDFANCLLEMQVVQISVDKEQEGYDIFEILNARGTPLAQHELLKNYIYKFYKPIGDIDNAKKLWTSMEDTLTISKKCALHNFVIHYTVHKYEKPNKTNTVLRIIKKYNQKNNTKAILDDLYEKSQFYRWLISPADILESDLFDKKDITENIYSILLYFSLKNQSQFRPLLLSLFSKVKRAKDNYFEAKELSEKGGLPSEELPKLKNKYRECERVINEAITYLLHFFIIEFVIKKQQPKIFEQTVHDLAAKIENEIWDVNYIYTKLKISITEDMFISNFCLLGYSNKVDTYDREKTKHDIRQLLRMYEIHLQGTDELTINNMTIEHIANDSIDSVTNCYIGNLLPLAASIQAQIGEETSFKAKIAYYRNSQFETVKSFVKKYSSHQIWSDSKIKERSENMARTFYNDIFKLGS